MLKNYIFTLCLILCSVALCDTQEDIVTQNTVDISTLPPRSPEIEAKINEINKAINELDWGKVLQGDPKELKKLSDVKWAIVDLEDMKDYNPERDSIDLNSARTQGEIKAKEILKNLPDQGNKAKQKYPTVKKDPVPSYKYTPQWVGEKLKFILPWIFIAFFIPQLCFRLYCKLVELRNSPKS